MEVCEAKDVHDQLTRRDKSYCFTPKHHGAGSKSDSRWLPDLPRPEEFAVFDLADWHQLSDDDGNLYGLGIRREGTERELLDLGTHHEQIARFWSEENQGHWHGHPLWPVDKTGAPNRRSQRYRPPKAVFDRMIQAGLLGVVEVNRLKVGRHVRKLDSGI